MTMQPPPAPGPTHVGAPPSGATPTASRARIADVIVSIVLMLAGAVGAAMLAFVSLFLAMMSDGCYDDRCDTGLMTAGWLLALLMPPAIFLAAIVWTIVRLARRRVAWWVPIAGAAVGVVAWFVGVGIMEASLGR